MEDVHSPDTEGVETYAETKGQKNHAHFTDLQVLLLAQKCQVFAEELMRFTCFLNKNKMKDITACFYADGNNLLRKKG